MGKESGVRETAHCTPGMVVADSSSPAVEIHCFQLHKNNVSIFSWVGEYWGVEK